MVTFNSSNLQNFDNNLGKNFVGQLSNIMGDKNNLSYAALKGSNRHRTTTNSDGSDGQFKVSTVSDGSNALMLFGAIVK